MTTLSITGGGPIGGAVRIPGSKSHTIRGLFIGSLAGGESVLRRPLVSGDTASAVRVCRALGAGVEEFADRFVIRGTAGRPQVPEDVVDVGNSGTSLYIGLGAAALVSGTSVFTGDGQIRRRTAEGLIRALTDLGAQVYSTRGGGLAPIVVRGPLRGGETRIECPTSQYLTSLLLSAPLASGESRISVPLLNEIPYVRMTLGWLENQGVRVEHGDDFSHFRVPGGQTFKPFDRAVPADFSSATFFVLLAAVTGGDILLEGLDLNDTQGDRRVLDVFAALGARVTREETGVRVRGGELRGAEIDLNDMPDALPALAVAGCFARGTTRLVNVAHARLKETDRIRVMAGELRALGADIEERPDGLVVRESRLRGADVSGHEDHRVVMALAVAGAAAGGETRVDTAQAAAVTFPEFVPLMRAVGCRVETGERSAPGS